QFYCRGDRPTNPHRSASLHWRESFLENLSYTHPWASAPVGPSTTPQHHSVDLRAQWSWTRLTRPIRTAPQQFSTAASVDPSGETRSSVISSDAGMWSMIEPSDTRERTIPSCVYVGAIAR